MDENTNPTAKPQTGPDRLAVEAAVDIKDGDGKSDGVLVEGVDGEGSEAVAVVDEGETEETLPIVIEVNRRSISMGVRRATGSEIKAAAIAQGVQIEMDFLLAVRRHGRTDPVKDKQEVRLHQGECFVANAADDNS
jgi:hypothetical protein